MTAMGSVDEQVRVTRTLRQTAMRLLSTLPGWHLLTDTEKAQKVADWIVAESKKMRGHD